MLGLAAFGLASVATAVAVARSRRPPALAAGSLLAVVIDVHQSSGWSGPSLPSDFATRSRYVYVAAFFLVLVVADWLPLLRDCDE